VKKDGRSGFGFLRVFREGSYPVFFDVIEVLGYGRYNWIYVKVKMRVILFICFLMRFGFLIGR
jgi:hypothetical protein